FYYDNKIVKMFAYATIFWGVVGMLVGVLIALQMVLPAANFSLPFTSFGRVRPVHTNAVIFAFVGNGIFTGYYYSLQRLLKTGMASNWMTRVHFWGWQSIIVLAAVSLLAGFTTGKEYAELEWPIDILIAAIWVIFGWNMMWTILKRRVKHIYVAIWFFIATFVTVAVLHIVNSLEIPWSIFKSYPVFAGVQDALVQWWYGHNAVAFFLTTPYLGLMYYFMPKAANRPVYSYKLSILHFWALIFLYIWAGPHHLLYQALPNWAQSLGTVFSIMLIAPSWGGMINGLLTLRGAWDRVREEPVLKFFVVAVTAYGMSTFEGPMLSLKNINAISHFTNWTVAHVHIGALGWNGFMTFGMIYWLFPRMFGTKLYSNKLANLHFWIGTLAMLFYSIPLYWAGWTEASMWKQFTPAGDLVYPNYLEIVTQIMPMYWMRLFGGTLYFLGMFLLVYNIYKTVKAGSFIPLEAAEAPALEKEGVRKSGESYHRFIERRPIQFMILAIIAILIGGIIEIIPTFIIKSNIPTIATVKPYTPLELQGRDIYIKEGCYVCHSQMVRPFRSETERYGEYSKAGEYVYDHPFQWGSKRIGPDLFREGVKSGPLYKSNTWHYTHFMDPQKVNAQSIMPKYPWLAENEIDVEATPAKIRVMQYLGVPYPEGYDLKANDDLKAQAETIALDLKTNGIDVAASKQVIALIAYIQRLGTDVGDSKTALK
ncbi:MAG: cytochrome-c oxidase, cbb3-type subunit I, partial [Bacteroidota bacterium]